MSPGSPRTRPMDPPVACGGTGSAARSRSCHCCSVQQHTAQYQPGQTALIRYKHHPRCGCEVIVVRCWRHRDGLHVVVEQPDGTLMQLPAWMLNAGAADLRFVESPLLPLPVLRELRRLIGDGLPSSAAPSAEGDKNGRCSDIPARPVPAARPANGTDPADAGTGDYGFAAGTDAERCSASRGGEVG